MGVDFEGLESEPEPQGFGYVERLLAGPGVSLLLMALVSLATWTGAQAGNVDPFVLQPPFGHAWWQLPLSVFAHSGMAHLTANATMVAVAGGVVVLFSSLSRYHLFFLTAGIASGVAQVAATDALGVAGGVLGASGAALALVAYIITSNAASSWLLGRVPRWMVAASVLGVTVTLTLRYSGANVANVAHFTGAAIGAVAGHSNILRAG